MSIISRLGKIKVRRTNVVDIVFGVIILVITFGNVFLIQGSYAKPTYSLLSNKLIISGQYGVEMNPTVRREYGN